ncbi:amino acid adenylation domain-containing protein [Xanthomonas bundabergensis]|uniref:non-ribosomal peptide synthetase n=1 Tax=Xanthomonas bundabergensis TaxID=3160842 RepID=UPI003513CC45
MERTALKNLSIAEKERLLKLARAKLAPHYVATSPIRPVDRGGVLPLSWAQQRLWFLDQLDHAAGAAYHIPAALRLSGALDRAALQASLDRIVARHENLRTTFVSVEGEPRQAIAAADSGFALTEHDLRGLDATAQESAVAELSLREARAPFDLAQGPLIRGRLLVLSEREHVLLVTQHHIVSDGWSIGVLVKEVGALYAAFSQGRSDPLPPLPIQYADYAAWQRQWLQGEVLQGQIDFWRKQLSGAPALLELPTDRPRPAVQSYRGDRSSLRLSRGLSDKLRALSQRHGTTLFMTLLAGWSVLLSRLSGQTDLVIGSPVANRQRAEIEPLVGFFVNTLALRVDLGADPTVAELLAQVRATTLGAYAHQDLPFEQVVEAVQPARSFSHSPVFQVLLVLNNTPGGEGTAPLPDLTLATVETVQQTAQFDLALSLADSADGLVGGAIYATDLFDGSTIERMLGHWVTLLEAMVADDAQPVTRLPLLTAAEREQVVAGFNATRAPYPQEALVHALFEAHAARQPHAIALECEGTGLSYGELNRRANLIAHRLIELGVGPDDRVVLCAQRGIALAAGMLGVLKAGGAYVPLDPALPSDRLAYMLEDIRPAALLTDAALRDAMPVLGTAACPLLVFDQIESSSVPRHASDPVVDGLTSRHLAYVIYTSGSTGKPKGVMVEHRNVVHLTIDNPDVPIVPSDCVGHCSNPAFDASTWEIWGALLNGARLLVIPQPVLMDPQALGEALREGQATLLLLTVGLFNEYVNAFGLSFAGLKYLLIGGDVLDPRSVARALQGPSPPAHLLNCYGPTEATTFATTYRVASVSEGMHSIPIGRPIANAQVYVLDARGEPMPIGVAGELHIGGAGVARGYLHRPELTAERFPGDRFAKDPGARMYRTGDLCRWRPDGTLEYLGRNDFQVKVRGFRIELGEIEARLAACAGVREAVVLAREDVPGDKRLVAYVVPQDGHVLAVAALREALSQVLPEYMVPSAFVTLAVLPLTPNGKLDRKALPAPDQAAVASRSYEAPVGEVEQALATIWHELLGLAQVGRHDHFFELGGHSLLAVRLVTRVRATLGVELALREVFAQPVLALLAKTVSAAAATVQEAIVPVDRTGVLPLSWAQQRLWFLDQLDHAAGAAYHIPAALRLSGDLDRTALQASLDRVVARHESLRTTFVSVEGEPQQVIAPADSGFALAEHDLRELDTPAQEAAIAKLSRAEARAPFDLAQGPLIRGRLLQLSESEHVLLVTQHHIVSDGWSIGLLVKEVSALYTAFRDGASDPLPALPVQYADYATWQRRWLQGAALEDQLAFWKTQLHDAPALLELPTDRPRPAVQSYRGARIAVRVPQALSEQLQRLSQQHGTTLFMTLLASWSALLARLSGQGQVVIGSPVANRQRAEIEPLIGFFVNTLALHVDLRADPSVAELLAQVRTTTLGAYAHQDLPFEQVVEAVQPARSLSHSPVFQAMLSLNNTPSEGALQLPGLVLAPVETGTPSAQFDLSLSLSETPDGLVGALVYAADLFERASMERLLGHWQTLLAAMVAETALPVSRLPLLSADEREQVLVGFNATQAAYLEVPIHALFEVQAAQQPQAIALECGDQRLSYGALNARANQLAHRLIALGVRPDDRVAICMPRSVDMVVGLLGILKAGGAYVPLDPAYPAERLAYMLSDSAPVALLTQAQLAETVVGVHANVADVSKVALVMLDETLAAQPAHDPVIAGLTSRHLAYVIYTSGSTGKPKGVMIEHANAANLVAWAQASFSAEQLATTLLSTSINFDLAVFELFVPLSTGRTVRLVPDLVSAGAALAGTTLVNTVPSAIAAVLDGDGLPASVTTVNLAGEPLKRALVERVFAASQAQVVANLYGPSETTTYSTWTAMTRADGFVGHIGRPIANTQVYVLGAQGEPVPIGVAGEIHIAGAGVARGYLNRPDMTAERFLADPFVEDANARMYRTGDLGRWLPDGTLEYLGRNDFQVKVRGFRIELGEIEARLAACAGVREAVVLAREDVPGDKRLVAYVVAEEGAEPSAMALREALLQVLPEYMVPSAFVTLAVLPLTPNGKLDRKALPAPDQAAVASRIYEAPVGEVEQALATIWQELLGLERVGRHDHFFELGGHSLLAVRLVTRVRATLGVELALREVFAQPVLASLARSVSAAAATVQEAIVPVDRTGALPLSWAQQRLWFLDQLDHAAGAAYHIPAALRLSGDLDRTALQASLDRVVARHESLRTTFVSVEGEPQQVIAAADVGFALATHDLRELDAPAQEAAIAELSSAEARAPFDLAQGPLIRGRLLQLSESEHVLLVTQHHIVSDGWSIGVLVREVSALYTAFREGAPDPLPALPVQYADYAAWQRRWLQGAALREQLAFWKTQLGEAPALLELPTDRPRPAVQSYRGARIAVRVPQALSEHLQRLSQQHGTTLFMTLLASWSALLSRLSGQAQVVIGSPVANRQRAEIEPLIGFFVNTLALYVDLRADPSVAELLAQVRTTTLGAYAHQDLPFEQVVEAVQPARSLSHSPVFQAMLSLNNTPSEGALQLPGLALAPVETGTPSAQFDLSLSLSETPDGLSGALVYAADLFERASMERLLGHWQTLLAAMMAETALPVSRLPLLSADERAQVLHGFNATSMDYPQDTPIHALFQAQAAQQPQAIALECGDQRLSYGALNARANQLAHRLIALGVRPDDRVAICMPRSVDMVVGLLGILKAGGAYVPLDPAYPAERLAYMLSDSAPVALLTQAQLAETVVGVHANVADVSKVALVMLDETLAAQPAHDPVIAGLTSRHLAYVIYTSGSTGKPKGVMIEHANAANLVAWAQASFSAEQLATTLLSTSINFDLAVFELFVPLSTGRTVRLVPDLVSAGAALAGTTLVNTVPSAIAAVLDGDGLPASVTTVNLAGEPLKRALVERVFAASQAQVVANLYGPSETTTYSTWTAMTRADGFVGHIGRPIANTQVYVLGAQGEPVPIGVAGEIHIAGAGVARGYLNRPDLTAERFLADPFASDAMARMYRTGDLGRWLPDGTLEYLGRNDFQVKVRGFRIELGEIEARLAACAGVREAVVLAREDVPGDKRLVAYVVAEEGAEPSAMALREALLQVLPEYMVPSAFVTLAALPLTPNGKLDRKALPAPDQAAVASRSYEAPVGEVEQALATIWQELLGLERVGRHDHFFELGGHSLLAVRLVTRVRATLGVELALREVFAQPVLASLARSVSAAAATVQEAIVPVDRTGALPLSWAQQRLWFLDQLDHAAGAAYHIPAALRLSGDLDRAALQASLDRAVARHESLRTTFVSVEGEPQQVIAPANIGFALATHDLRELDAPAQEAAIAELSSAEARAAFDLERGPLIRGRLLQLSEQEHVLLVTQHHIVSDGWSIGVLVREVSALYTAFREGAPDPLPALPVQYADYAAWQRRWLQGTVLEEQLAFWKAQLGEAPALLELPTDRPRPMTMSYRGGSVPARLPAELVGAVRSLSKQHGTTLFMTLLASWSALLARLSGQGQVVIGSPVANRQRAEIEPLIGFFVNTLALHVDLRADPTVTELLAQVRTTTLGAYAHQDLPFEQVVEAVQPARSLSHSPVFQAMLSLNNTPSEGALQLPGLALAPVETGTPSAQFDLSLSLSETPDGLSGALVYAADLFERASMERLLGHWQTLLAAMMAETALPVSRLPLLSADERAQVLHGFNATQAAYPEVPIHTLFQAQATRQPQAIALECGDQQLSYGALNDRANQLAHRLIELGVRPDDRVAICMPRSVDMVVGLLGILKAGGAYVPLDPAYPAERLAYMLADSAPVALLTQAQLAGTVKDLHTADAGLAVVAMDTDAALLQQPTHDPVIAGLTSRHLAYVIYTSGSTGQPKGVMIEHASVVNLCAELEHSVFGGLPGDERVALNASLSFDASVQALTQLLSGRCVVVIPEAVRIDAGALLQFLSQHRIGALDCTPAQLGFLLDAGLLESPIASLKAVLVGGEAIAPGMWTKLSRSATLRIFNVYGPTECTVDSTLAAVNDAGERPHIGGPIANARVYILDAQGQPVPIGVAGELHIGGAGVARGYLNQPGLTLERFVDDPFVEDPAARMYRTGDLGRWLPDGTIEYLGRNDFQVKVRGFRIELGEIEARLAACTGVREAVVLAREDVPGDKRLVAYVTAEEETELSVAALREALLQALPEHMVPNAFVALPALPLTPSGKLDRKALPAPDQAAVASRSYEAPVGEIEQAIAAIWQELLGLERVGRHDHFFELGGHSLLAIKLMHALRMRLGAEVPIAAIFSTSSLTGLASMVETGRHSQSLVVPLQTQGEDRPLFCFHPVGGHVSFYRALARQLAPQLPVYGIQAPDAIGLPHRFEAIADMASAYASAIHAAQAIGPYRLLGWSTGGVIASAVAAHMIENGDEIEYLGLIDSRSNFDDAGMDEDELMLKAALVELRGNGFSQKENGSGRMTLGPRSVKELLQMEFLEAEPYLRQWLKPGFNAETFGHFRSQVPITHRHLRLLAGYRPSPVQAPVQTFWATRHAVSASANQGPHAAEPWTSGTATRHLDTDHYGLMAEPNVQRIAEAIVEFLQPGKVPSKPNDAHAQLAVLEIVP